jgi:hypothetical protein
VDFIAEGFATQEIKKELADLTRTKKTGRETIEKNIKKRTIRSVLSAYPKFKGYLDD